jgi:hypothetical protein
LCCRAPEVIFTVKKERNGAAMLYLSAVRGNQVMASGSMTEVQMLKTNAMRRGYETIY